jgi:hypothetical protein
MEEYFAKNNRESTRELFNKRLIYNAQTKTPLYPNLVDFGYAEKRLYGRVDRQYIPMVNNNYLLPLKAITADTSPLKSSMAINCVADAFQDLSEQFQKKIMRNEIDSSDKYLANLQVYKAFENPQRLYGQHLTAYSKAFNKIIKAERIKFVSFKSFINKVMPYIYVTARTAPFTLPAFIKSTSCPINVSGLAIEIADLDPSNDKEKWKEFYQSNNWEFYLNACAGYGFMVDQHVPWRLVADIGSAQMLQYSARYEIMNTDEFLRATFEPAHRRYFDVFKNTLYRMYVENRQKRMTSTVHVGPEGTRAVIRRPNNSTREELYDRYDAYYFLNLYCKIRFVEEESSFTVQEQDRIIDNTIELAQIDFEKALDTFELILNKPFDYVGSLSYISSAWKEIKEMNE